jgi:hypothetical protein
MPRCGRRWHLEWFRLEDGRLVGPSWILEEGKVADLGPSIVVAVTGIVSFGLGFAADMIRHHLQRGERLQDERISVYARYISAARQSATLLSGPT